MNRYNEISSVMKRDLRSFFNSPIAYIVITVFLSFTGFFFFKDFFYINQAEMRNLFTLLPLMFCFFIPAVTMKLFAEERQTGSLEILLTLPVSARDAVIGKFLAGLIFSMGMVSPTLIYLLTVILNGSPDYGPVIGGYFGVVFLAGAYTAIGLLASSITRNQIVAFILGWAGCFLFWLIDKVVIFIPSSLGFIATLGTDYHFQSIARGIIDTRDVIYFLSIIAISLILTAKIAEERR
ncbi:MAG TPA: ABC transporter permease subunit [Spirochaetota bacterium]|nr:ABC transporter permease subunit [Spirochaetota bacterium]